MLDIKSKKIGAELTSINLDDQERLHQGAATLDENKKPFWNRHAPVLFPIVGQIKDGKTIINGEEFHNMDLQEIWNLKK